MCIFKSVGIGCFGHVFDVCVHFVVRCNCYAITPQEAGDVCLYDFLISHRLNFCAEFNLYFSAGSWRVLWRVHQVFYGASDM